MKKVMIIALIFLILIPAVSAEIILDETLSEFTDTGGSRKVSWPASSNPHPPTICDHRLYFKEISNHPDTKYVIITRSGNRYDEGVYDITYNLNGQTRPAHKYVTHQKNLLGAVTHTRIEIFFDDWDIGSLTGTQYITFSQPIWNLESGLNPYSPKWVTNDLIYITPPTTEYCFNDVKYDITVVSVKEWKNHIKIESDDRFNTYILKLTRIIDTYNYASTVNAYKTDSSVFENGDSKNLEVEFAKTEIDKIELNSGKRVYTFPLVGDVGHDPQGGRVTVYIQNSQTGALLADAHIQIEDTTTDPWTEVANQTLTSGQGTISLAKDPGIHLTQYRIGATVPGYQQVVPALFFRVVGPTNVVVEMEPVEGGPVNEDNAYLEFYVRDISANAIANANVQVDGQLRWTNAQGYTQFEVAKNASYPYIVTKTGYLTIEGIASVESDDRYVVNVALMSGAVPTQPTVSPTITVEPTPTQTSPIQEDNLIGLSVRGLAKGFGIDYDTALLMFGLMIVFGAGGIVMSSVKGGAMEFIAGSIVGTFVAFALGLIPIWIFIIITVVFGAYVLRVFIQGGQ